MPDQNIDDQIRNIATEVALNQNDDRSYFSHDEEGEEVEEYDNRSEDEIKREVEDRDSRDVFDDVINPRTKAGDPVKVIVVRNGDQITTRLGSELKSWDQIHEEYGEDGGIFKVQAKSLATGRYLAQQTKSLGALVDKKRRNEETNPISDVFRHMMDMNRMNDEKFERMMEKMEQKNQDSGSSQTELMKTMMLGLTSVMANKKEDNSSMEFFKMMLENQQKSDQRMLTMIGKMDEKFEKQTDRFERTMEKLMDNLGKGRDEITWKDFYEAQDKAKKEGKEDAETLLTMIDLKAREKAEELAESKGDESYIDKGMKLLMPMLGALQNNKPLAMPGHAHAPQVAQNPVPQQRRVLRQPQAGTRSPQAQGEAKTARATHRRSVSESRENTQKSRKIGGLPSVDAAPPKSTKVAPNPKPAKMDTVAQNADPEFKKIILDVTLPIIVEFLMSSGGSNDCALACIAALDEANIPTQNIGELFTLDDVFALANQYGIIQQAQESGQGEQVQIWFREFHAGLVQEAAS